MFKSENCMTFPRTFFLFACTLVLANACIAASNTEAGPKLNVLKGPARAQLESIAEVEVPTGYVFLDGKSTRAMLKAEGEPVSGDELGFLKSTNSHWSVFFQFSGVGYVKDDEKNDLKADKLLESIKRGNEAANKERVRAGGAPLEIVGWEVPPRYDEKTHNLEWAIRATSEGRPILNYNTRLLGRKGVMEVILVVSPDDLAETLPTFRDLLTGYSYKTGESYAEYRSGDKVAKYGLAALVVGGAAVGAAKLGLFAWLAVFLKKGWKLLVIAVAAVSTWIKKLFSKRSERAQ